TYASGVVTSPVRVSTNQARASVRVRLVGATSHMTRAWSAPSAPATRRSRVVGRACARRRAVVTSLRAVDAATPSRRRSQVANVRAVPPERHDPSSSMRGSTAYRTPSSRPVTRRSRPCADTSPATSGTFQPSRPPARSASSPATSSRRARARSHACTATPSAPSVHRSTPHPPPTVVLEHYSLAHAFVRRGAPGICGQLFIVVPRRLSHRSLLSRRGGMTREHGPMTTSRTSGDATSGTDAQAAELDRLRPLAFSVAYRMLGSVAEAEDVVQEALTRVSQAEDVRNPDAFVTTVTTRISIDVLRSAR